MREIAATVYLDESRPKMFLLFSHLIDEKFASFLTYLKSWWKVVLVFGKEHANWSNISGVMIGWSWKVMFGKVEMGVFALKSCIVTKKIMYFSNLDFCSSINHNFINIGQNDMFYTKKCNYFSRGTRWECLILF